MKDENWRNPRVRERAPIAPEQFAGLVASLFGELLEGVAATIDDYRWAYNAAYHGRVGGSVGARAAGSDVSDYQGSVIDSGSRAVLWRGMRDAERLVGEARSDIRAAAKKIDDAMHAAFESASGPWRRLEPGPDYDSHRDGVGREELRKLIKAQARRRQGGHDHGEG